MTDPADSEDLVVLVSGTEASGAEFWAYVAMSPDRHAAFLAAQKQGDYRLNDFGRILESGPGLVPPGNISRRYAG